jgi:hypothetical protein
MNAQLISIEDDEWGDAVISMAGVEIIAMDSLGYGTSDQPYPMVGQFFEPCFTCLFDDSEPIDWLSLFGGNPLQEQRLEPKGNWSYRAYGKLVASDSPDDNLLADCGGGADSSSDRCLRK